METIVAIPDYRNSGAPLLFTAAAAHKVHELIAEEGNPALKLRVYITGGGCSGFQYGFTFDAAQNEDDFAVEQQKAGVRGPCCATRCHCNTSPARRLTTPRTSAARSL
jgi:hypothetical protein